MSQINFSKHFRLLILGLVIGLTLNVATFAQDTEENFDPQSFFSEDLDLDSLIVLYHEQVNHIFNTSIQKLITALKGHPEGIPENLQKALEAPEDDAVCFQGNGSGSGGVTNISTYCLALRVDNLYENYLQALKYQGAKLIISPEESKSQILTQTTNQIRQQKIEREMVNAKKAFDTTLSAYQELQTAFPLHMQFEGMKDYLIKYRDRLVEVRKKVDTFPNKFLNATSTQCQ